MSPNLNTPRTLGIKGWPQLHFVVLETYDQKGNWGSSFDPKGPGGVQGNDKSISNFILIKKFEPIFGHMHQRMYLQLLTFDYKRLLNKPYVNEVNLTGQNQLLKCC